MGCEVPFNIVNSSFFKDMISSLNNAAVRYIPKSETFINNHIVVLFNETMEEVSKLWNSYGSNLMHRTIGFDSFMNELGESVINMTETANGKCAFIECVDPGKDRENS